MSDKLKHERYEGPAGGWGSLKSVTQHATRQHAVHTINELIRDHNKVGGYMCTSCAWAKPAEPHLAEFCENGAKATFWDLTDRRATPAFFARHTLTELLNWSDHDLENTGRLTHPLCYDASSDTYQEVSWEEAFAAIGQLLQSYDPEAVIFYTSGRASLETSYMYQLFARLYGNNNLPDSSNMCHETTSVALPQSIGTSVGTVLLEDFEHTDCIFSFGQNVGTNSPRLLHQLQAARERGVPIVVFNPLRERGWEEFVNPQRAGQMLTPQTTTIATQYYQVRAGGDIAVLLGLAKALLTWDEEAQSQSKPRVLDIDFIHDHTSNLEDFARMARQTSWQEIEHISGLSRSDLEAAARTYAQAQATIAIFGMGLTQHRLGVDNVHMLTNLLLLRGNIGRRGAGVCPIRGHSNVQGQRTVGIAEKVELVPLDAMAERYGFEPPRQDGMNTVEVCEALEAGRLQAFVGLGGNFLRAIPDSARLEAKWRELDLSVQIATKLNRTHLITARHTYLLPTLVRSEIDQQGSGTQIVTVEDSTTCIHASRGKFEPASPHLLSEPRIVAELAHNTLPPNDKVPWRAWAKNYALVRNEIAAIYPKDFYDFNSRLDTPGGFPRKIAARERIWETESGRANFLVPRALDAGIDADTDPDVLRLITLRSNDQFNTTVYGYSDRFRGIEGSRMVVMINPRDRERLGIPRDSRIRLITVSDDDVVRTLGGFTALDYNIPEGTLAAYYPECNPLIPLHHYAQESKTPAAKSVPVRIAVEA